MVLNVLLSFISKFSIVFLIQLLIFYNLNGETSIPNSHTSRPKLSHPRAEPNMSRRTTPFQLQMCPSRVHSGMLHLSA